MSDALSIILEVLLWTPFAWGLLLVGAYVGWSFFGTIGVMGGSIIGFLLGLALDFSNHWAAKYLRLAIAFAAVVLLMVTFLK